MKWFRLENESVKAFQAFCVFIVLHPDPIEAVANAIGSRLCTLKAWMRKYDWLSRKEAFFESVLTQNPDDMHLRHIKEAIALQHKALKKFNSIDPENLSNSEVIRFLTAGANLERAARRAFETANTPFDESDEMGSVDAFLNSDEER